MIIPGGQLIVSIVSGGFWDAHRESRLIASGDWKLANEKI